MAACISSPKRSTVASLASAPIATSASGVRSAPSTAANPRASRRCLTQRRKEGNMSRSEFGVRILCAFAALREIFLRAAAGSVCLALVVQLSFCAGCVQPNRLGTVPVSGKVTYKGQPVSGATVSFIPDGEGRPATAITAADGGYKLTTLDADGAMPGQYSVVVRKSDVAADSTKPVSMEEALK